MPRVIHRERKRAPSARIPVDGTFYTRAQVPITQSVFYTIHDILGESKGSVPIIPVSRSTWYKGVKSGRFPKPASTGGRKAVWRRADIDALVERWNATVE